MLKAPSVAIMRNPERPMRHNSASRRGSNHSRVHRARKRRFTHGEYHRQEGRKAKPKKRQRHAYREMEIEIDRWMDG